MSYYCYDKVRNSCIEFKLSYKCQILFLDVQKSTFIHLEDNKNYITSNSSVQGHIKFSYIKFTKCFSIISALISEPHTS